MININNIFKGWYFKCSTDNFNIAFIVAMHNNCGKESASLQIISNDDVYYFPYKKINFNKSTNSIHIGKNVFSPKHIHLDINTDKFNINGDIRFTNHVQLSYDIMGPFKYLPFMQCKHKVYSMSSIVNGTILIQDDIHTFINGKGYIEGDSGYSFPKEYAWTQTHFPNGSLMLAIAHIPICNLHFTGIIGVIMINNHEYRFATYLGAKSDYIGNNTICISQGNYQLCAKLLESKEYHLHAPKKGSMSRFIKESAICKAHYCLKHKGKVLLDFESNSASFEYEYK